MSFKQTVVAGVVVLLAMIAIAFYFTRPQPQPQVQTKAQPPAKPQAEAQPADDIATGPLLSSVPATATGDLNQLPTTAASGASVEGTAATGRVERVWIRVSEGILVEPAKAPTTEGWRYVSIEFPDPLANGTTAARALVPTDMVSGLGIGDVVEMRFANRNRGIPLVSGTKLMKERDQLTKVVAKSGTDLARDYEKRILARGSADPATGEKADVALWKNLPLDKAVKIVRGNGSRQMAVFSDPYCPACRDFERTMQQVDNVTVHLFLLPVIRPEKADVSKKIWCSPDRAKAWQEVMLNDTEPAAEATCPNPVQDNLALIKTIGIRATPTMVFESGQRAQGSLLAASVRESLDRKLAEPAR